MLLAYVDESGNSGDPLRGATATYTLGCLLMDADAWPDAFDRFVDFRRRLGRQFGIRMRDEVKANYLLHDKGDLRALALSRGQRREIYERHMRLAEHLPAQAFAIVIVKARHRADGPDGIVRRSWTYLAQRLEHACRENSDTLMIIHDEGENDEVRRVLRRARRVMWAGSVHDHDPRYLRLPRLRLVDDPVPRKSHHSYFTQMADLVAYAGYRHAIPPREGAVCPQAMWGTLGQAIRREVNSLAGKSDGVVVG
jgi:hypothetical protein